VRRRLRPTARLVLTVALASAFVAGCSSGDDAPSGASAEELASRLESARTTLDEAESLEFSITTAELPSGVTGLLSAAGVGNHDPAFEGDVKVSSGGTIDAEVVAVDDTVYAKTGFAPVFVPVDPTSLGSPDPADLMRADGGITTLLTETGELQEGEQSRDGSNVLTSITGTAAGSVVKSLIPTADEGADFDATYRLTDDDVLRDAKVTGPFYAGSDAVSYTIEVTASDQDVDITAP